MVTQLYWFRALSLQECVGSSKELQEKHLGMIGFQKEFVDCVVPWSDMAVGSSYNDSLYDHICDFRWNGPQMKMHHSFSVPTKVVHAKEGQLSHPTSSWDTGRGKGGIEASKRHLRPRGLGCCGHLAVGDGSSSQCNVQGSQKLHSNSMLCNILIYFQCSI